MDLRIQHKQTSSPSDASDDADIMHKLNKWVTVLRHEGRSSHLTMDILIFSDNLCSYPA